MKRTMKYHKAPIRKAKTWNTEHHMLTVQSNKHSHFLLVGMQNGTATLEGSLAVFLLNVLLPEDPPIVLLDIYSKELKTSKTLHMGIFFF